MPASQSEEITTVHKGRQTEQRNTDDEGLLINPFSTFGVENIPGQWHSNITHLVNFSDPRQMCLQYQLRTLRYRTVMRDQRWRCPELDSLSSNHCDVRWATLLTQIKSTCRAILSEMAALLNASTYLLFECHCWKIRGISNKK